MKTKLIGSAPSINLLLKLTHNWLCGTSVVFVQKDTKTWEVHNSDGLINDLIVIKKGNRFRLEMISE